MKSKYYNFRLDELDQGRLQEHPQDLQRGQAQAARAVQHPHVDRGEEHDERRLPRPRNAAIGEIFNLGLIPQMFAQVARQDDAAGGGQGRRSPFKTIFKKWRDQGLVP